MGMKSHLPWIWRSEKKHEYKSNGLDSTLGTGPEGRIQVAGAISWAERFRRHSLAAPPRFLQLPCEHWNLPLQPKPQRFGCCPFSTKNVSRRWAYAEVFWRELNASFSESGKVLIFPKTWILSRENPKMKTSTITKRQGNRWEVKTIYAKMRNWFAIGLNIE